MIARFGRFCDSSSGTCCRPGHLSRQQAWISSLWSQGWGAVEAHKGRAMGLRDSKGGRDVFGHVLSP